ncbi:MAG: DUF2784 domain-containing protein, partial [Proteobacteria bacterium]|nr:DUF2784 domain-containing protein [Pseudomonadota bacterium]
MYVLLADLILVVHVLFAAFNLLGLVAIWVGAALGMGFVRNRWFRGFHLLAMAVVVAESLGGVVCPLTRWETSLRHLAGTGRAYHGSFMHHWARQFFYFDLPPEVFTLLYVLFFAAMLLTL